jgi:hypothetical protein
VDSVHVPPRSHFRGIPATSDVPGLKLPPTHRTSASPHAPSRAAWVVGMTGTVITPVIFPTTTPRHDTYPARSPGATPATRYPLPLPVLHAPRTSNAVYGLAAVDCRGRIADHTITALAWTPDTRLNFHECQELLILRTHTHGTLTVTRQGHLRLPATATGYTPRPCPTRRPPRPGFADRAPTHRTGRPTRPTPHRAAGR